MEAHDRSFYFMSTPSYYDIPFFQRAYVWSEENWEELLQNLTDESQNHFLGSIILKNEVVQAGDIARYFVIDGQQRLTTLSVLLRACFDHIANNNDEYQYSQEILTKNKGTMENLLFVAEGGFSSALHIKINHSHLDKKAYETVVNGDLAKGNAWEQYLSKQDSTVSAIIRGYAYFRNEFKVMDQKTIERLWDLLTMDKIRFLVNIDLGVDDNEQAIFDTVNTAGVRLSSADTIKNLLYQRYIEILRQEGIQNADDVAIKKYDETWATAFLKDEDTDSYWLTERQYGRMMRSNIETFLHAFAVLQGLFNPATDTMVELPQKYRDVVFSMDKMAMEQLLTDVDAYASVFKDYFFSGQKSIGFEDSVDRILNICGALEISTFYPYVLQQLYDMERGEAASDEVNDRLFALERYLVLNAICKGSTENYNNECVQLVDKKRTPNEICQSSIYITEESFASGLRRMTANKLPTMLLFWVELYKRNQDKVDIKQLVYDYTLEHIMPRKWQQNWMSVPSFDTNGNLIEDSETKDRVRSRAIYEIGNMTLLNSRLNSSISNSAFTDKVNGKNGKKGIKDLADLMLTKEVINNNNDWNESKIYARTIELEELIRKIWDAEKLPEEGEVQTAIKTGSFKELRKEYWTLTLPKLRAAFGGNGSFSKVNPGTDNWISGYVGVSGIQIRCIFTDEEARTEIAFCSSKAEKNIDNYNKINSRQGEIETQLERKLLWNPPNANKKSATIGYARKNLQITNKACWDMASDFHAEYAKMLCDEVLSYLKDEYPDLDWNR